MKMPVECDLSPVGRDFQCVIASTAKNSLNEKRDAKKSKYKEKWKHLSSRFDAYKGRVWLRTTKECSSLYV